MSEIPIFKIRCSAISKIMTDGKDSGGLTDKQTQRLDDLHNQKKLTQNQAEEVVKLINKRDKPAELSAGAKTYCQSWLKEKIYGRRAEIKSKYLEKGNLCEEYAISMLNYLFSKRYAKNEAFFEDEYMTGTPDINAEMIRDTKCSWCVESYPLFDLKVKDDYRYQMLGYMNLTGHKKASVDFCLVNAPEHLIEREARQAAYTSNKTELELYQKYTQLLTFDDIEPSKRVRSFEVLRNETEIQKIKDRVVMCREYIKNLTKRMER